MLKYGEKIGKAKVPIPAGSWVHLHNLCSERGKGTEHYNGNRTRRAKGIVSDWLEHQGCTETNGKDLGDTVALCHPVGCS
ncbi:hypothetical protein [Thermanaeromonas sp.]|uniref:hypothetical protein n=1 Tax=Thermanaeromonas sp. TaxID=2003697 RepID=UPI003412418C